MPGDLSALSKEELITLIHQLLREIDTLKETIIDLQEKLKQKGQGDDNSRQVPSFVKANLKKKRKAARKQRERGFSRKLDTPTKTLFHGFECCPECHGTLGYTSEVNKNRCIPVVAHFTNIFRK